MNSKKIIAALAAMSMCLPTFTVPASEMMTSIVAKAAVEDDCPDSLKNSDSHSIDSFFYEHVLNSRCWTKTNSETIDSYQERIYIPEGKDFNKVFQQKIAEINEQESFVHESSKGSNRTLEYYYYRGALLSVEEDFETISDDLDDPTIRVKGAYYTVEISEIQDTYLYECIHTDDCARTASYSTEEFFYKVVLNSSCWNRMPYVEGDRVVVKGKTLTRPANEYQMPDNDTLIVTFYDYPEAVRSEDNTVTGFSWEAIHRTYTRNCKGHIHIKNGKLEVAPEDLGMGTYVNGNLYDTAEVYSTSVDETGKRTKIGEFTAKDSSFTFDYDENKGYVILVKDGDLTSKGYRYNTLYTYQPKTGNWAKFGRVGLTAGAIDERNKYTKVFVNLNTLPLESVNQLESVTIYKEVDGERSVCAKFDNAEVLQNGLASFDMENELWDDYYWEATYKHVDDSNNISKTMTYTVKGRFICDKMYVTESKELTECFALVKENYNDKKVNVINLHLTDTSFLNQHGDGVLYFNSEPIQTLTSTELDNGSGIYHTTYDTDAFYLVVEKKSLPYHYIFKWNNETNKWDLLVDTQKTNSVKINLNPSTVPMSNMNLTDAVIKIRSYDDSGNEVTTTRTYNEFLLGEISVDINIERELANPDKQTAFFFYGSEYYRDNTKKNTRAENVTFTTLGGEVVLKDKIWTETDAATAYFGGASSYPITARVNTNAKKGDTLVIDGVTNSNLNQIHYTTTAYKDNYYLKLLNGCYTITNIRTNISANIVVDTTGADPDGVNRFGIHNTTKRDVILNLITPETGEKTTYITKNGEQTIVTKLENGTTSGTMPDMKTGGYSSYFSVSGKQNSASVDGQTVQYGYIYENNKGEKVSVSESSVLKGDVNLDGTVDVLDYIALSKFVLGSGSLVNTSSSEKKLTASVNADMNGDGEVDIFDSGLLKRMLTTSGFIVDLPVSLKTAAEKNEHDITGHGDVMLLCNTDVVKKLTADEFDKGTVTFNDYSTDNQYFLKVATYKGSDYYFYYKWDSKAGKWKYQTTSERTGLSLYHVPGLKSLASEEKLEKVEFASYYPYVNNLQIVTKGSAYAVKTSFRSFTAEEFKNEKARIAVSPDIGFRNILTAYVGGTCRVYEFVGITPVLVAEYTVS